jgi:hypothetical protein
VNWPWRRRADEAARAADDAEKTLENVRSRRAEVEGIAARTTRAAAHNAEHDRINHLSDLWEQLLGGKS